MTNRGFVIAFLITLIPTILIVVSCQNEPQVIGTLEGTVNIGPIWPVERPGESRPVPPQVFETRKVIVYSESKTKIIKTVDLIQIGQSSKANYSVRLIPGYYVVDVTHGGIDSSSEVPRKVEIRPGQTVVVDIDIDTGIR